MTVAELIEELKHRDQDAEVRLAQQPSWPFEYSIDGIVEVDIEEDEGDGKIIVYIGEGQQLGYLPGAARQELMW